MPNNLSCTFKFHKYILNVLSVTSILYILSVRAKLPPFTFLQIVSFTLFWRINRKVPGRFPISGSLITVLFYVRSGFEQRTTSFDALLRLLLNPAI